MPDDLEALRARWEAAVRKAEEAGEADYDAAEKFYLALTDARKEADRG